MTKTKSNITTEDLRALARIDNHAAAIRKEIKNLKKVTKQRFHVIKKEEESK